MTFFKARSLSTKIRHHPSILNVWRVALFHYFSFTLTQPASELEISIWIPKREIWWDSGIWNKVGSHCLRLALFANFPNCSIRQTLNTSTAVSDGIDEFICFFKMVLIPHIEQLLSSLPLIGMMVQSLLGMWCISINFHSLSPTSRLIVVIICYSESVHYEQPNGLILTNDGQIFRILVLGGDIQQCIVRRSRDIVVGYGDIGVFETGMTQGVVVFNENGKLKWANSRYDIVHSYATHDSGDRLWFSFYTEFKLTFTKLCCTSSKCTDLRGREGFLIHDDGKNAVFASPWYDEHAWYWVHRINQKWKKGHPNL